jgi:5-methylcytosine-specific restriction endonuclease McrA
LRRVADEIERTPPLEVYNEHGQYEAKTHKRRWGNWHDVLEKAGLEPTDHSEHWDDVEYDYEHPDGNVKVVCDYCGELTPKWEHQIKHNEHVYCDRGCKGGAMSEQTGEDARSWSGGNVPIECEWCGDIDHVKPSEVDKSRFCTQDCVHAWRADYFSGENHPRWTESDEYRYYGPNWDEQSQRCRDRDNNECQVCGRTNAASLDRWDESLTAHHIIRFYDFDGWETANNLANLVAACKICHGYLDSGRAGISNEHEQRFRAWVADTEKTVADATVKLD